MSASYNLDIEQRSIDEQAFFYDQQANPSQWQFIYKSCVLV
jgi:hypothetical protein